MAGIDNTVKVTWHGNESLMIGTLGTDGTVSGVVQGRGLVSLEAMKNSAESKSQFADDEVWTSVAGAPQLAGSIVFMQLGDDVRSDFFGQQMVAAKVGDIDVTGYADTGVYPPRIVEYLHEGTVTKDDGTTSSAALLTVYPKCQVSSTPTKASSTDTDDISVVEWTADIQATATDSYMVDGKKQAMYEYTVVGDDDVAKLKAAVKAGQFALPTTQAKA